MCFIAKYYMLTQTRNICGAGERDRNRKTQNRVNIKQGKEYT